MSLCLSCLVLSHCHPSSSVKKVKVPVKVPVKYIKIKKIKVPGQCLSPCASLTLTPTLLISDQEDQGARHPKGRQDCAAHQQRQARARAPHPRDSWRQRQRQGRQEGRRQGRHQEAAWAAEPVQEMGLVPLPRPSSLAPAHASAYALSHPRTAAGLSLSSTSTSWRRRRPPTQTPGHPVAHPGPRRRVSRGRAAAAPLGSTQL